MEEYNNDNDALHNVDQATNDFPMEINVNSEINKDSENLHNLDDNVDPPVGEPVVNQQVEDIADFVGGDLHSNILKETVRTLDNASDEQHLNNRDVLSIESELEKMHGGVSDTVDDVPPESSTVNENVSDKMDWIENTENRENSAKDFEENINESSIQSILEDKNDLENISDSKSDELSSTAQVSEKENVDPVEINTDVTEEENAEINMLPEEVIVNKDIEHEKDHSSEQTAETKSTDVDETDTDYREEHVSRDKILTETETEEDTSSFDDKSVKSDHKAVHTGENQSENEFESDKPDSYDKEKHQTDTKKSKNGKIFSLEAEVDKSDSKDCEGENKDEDQSSDPKDNIVLLDQDKDKNNYTERESTEFVPVDTEQEKDMEDNEKDDNSSRVLMEQDPIASDSFEPMSNEDREGADEELCIIPDTEREISQAERDAASSIPPLRDLTEASTSDQTENNSENISVDQSSGTTIIIFKYEKEDLQICNECKLKRKVKYYYTSVGDEIKFLCDDNCLNVFKNSQDDKVAFNWEEGGLRVKNFTGAIKEPPSLSFIRKCAACKKITNDIENNLTWEIMDFCNEFCLTKYQKEIGSHCSSCQGEVKSNSLGKYCVRFGNDIRQFCTSMCLEKYKKGLKVCSYCQQDMSSAPTGFLAPVGDKGQFKDFCSQVCMEKYDVMTNDRPPKVAQDTICSVCKAEKPITIEFELDRCPNYFCSEPCFVAFSFVNNISPGKCAMCRRHFTKSTLERHTMYYDNVQHSFCSNSCQNIYIIAHRKIVPCSWCKVKKYNFDMIRRYSKTGSMINMCSVNCFSLYRVSINAVNSKKTICNFCQKLTHPMYHLTMSDATIRNFCCYNCVMGFQNQFPKQPITLSTLGESGFPVPTGAPKKNKKHPGGSTSDTVSTISDVPQLPIISSVQSLASTNGNIGTSAGLPPSLTPITTRSTRSKSSTAAPQVLNSQVINSYADMPVQVQIKQHFIVRPAPMPDQRNVATMCYTRKSHKSTSMKPIMVDEEVQTEEREASKILIPVPVPIYVPTPMLMYSSPTPVPVPFPVPVPIPIFIPTTRNSAAGIMKEIKKIQVKIPTDPYEAELLMMAEMVAEEKKEDITDSESDVDDTAGPEDTYSPEPVDASNTFGDDMLQMALKMATELDEPAVDLEGALTANTITAPQGGESHGQEENVDDPQPMHHMMERTPSVRGRKRGMSQPRGGAKRGRRVSHHPVDMPMMQHQVQQPPPPPEPTEKPDANMCLKYTFGVNAWKQWVTTKNAELEKSSRRVMLFKTEILQLTADELNYSLCLFVKEVRKPNGAEYAPDTIYYLCLGIQQYLFENGRIDNIFCDSYYEKFTDCLDEVAKKFSVLYNDSHYIVTRVEEEHLWESKQLGAHSPHVLLSTLMFFNTKHFNLTSVDEHMQLSFSHIMKHWKRNPNQPGASKLPASRNVLLRFYPPQSAIQNNTRKKKVYEQQENEENPLRCPVKLYEFYLSKCPESVKTRNDVFYLQPERSCVPDSPVWYSTMPLPREALEKMLHRVKMVKEINVALLTS